jgi:hypothetical protein
LKKKGCKKKKKKKKKRKKNITVAHALSDPRVFAL